jgi:starch phosphorylase
MAKRKSGRSTTRAGDVPARVAALARNLWWTWNPDAQRLFAAMDPQAWTATNHNPLRVLAGLEPWRREDLGRDAAFLDRLRDCEQQLKAYMRARTWYQRCFAGRHRGLRVAYFCAEYGLHECFPQYAGGLGVLAGDHLKSASDLGIPLAGVGLLYRQGYYRQQLRADGTTHAVFPQYDFADWPIEDTRRTIVVRMARRSVRARIWRVQVGRVPLYLLDTDLPVNRPRDRELTARLYGGDQETRISQEILLGIGGLQALGALGVKATVFHLNEGHAAFCSLERLRQLRRRGLSMERALTRVGQSTVFTTHTPVSAGHDRFPPPVMRKYLGYMTEELGVPASEWLALGRVKASNRSEPFCMTVLALLTSDECNGVSKIHGRVSREMWQDVFDRHDAKTTPISHVTNGVHTATWLAPEMRPLVDKYIRPRWHNPRPDDDCWNRADRIPAGELWAVRQLLRRRLVQFVRQRLREQVLRRCEPLDEILAAVAAFDEHALTIGFARRFATYKRAPLIFRDAERLRRIVGDTTRPVQLVFAGKAHPADLEGQRFAQRVYQQARKAGLRGRVALIEDYDMHVGRMLTSGCDVWLNNPVPPQEASGTSGMKPPLHGGLNCSVPDGWWPEAYDGRNGWVIGEGKAARDRDDARAIYDVLEREIVPLFYKRGRDGVPRAWVRRMVRSMKTVCGQFNTHRMVAEYLERYSA